ncbi:MAG TPA: N-acetylmuramoyl-L-alanine amidase, partial [Thermoleophilaceae bacterium]|nr:N-acetylmuramoyl-L-alanine amidase [Thermoleophilaceae bacterium]
MARDLTRRQALAGSAGLALAPALAAPGGALARRDATDHFAVDVPLPRAGAARAGWLTSAPVRTGRSFDLIGARWRDGREVAVQVRVRRHGRWSRWLDLPNALDHGPDRGAKANGTDPAWIGGARMFQLRTRGRPRGLRAHMVVAGRRGLNRAVASRRAQSGEPTIITRSQWGAASFKGSPGYGSVQMAYVHHTVSLNSYSKSEAPAVVRGIQRYHQSSNGWSDIGYNFLVDRFGQIYEGRAGGIDRAVIGAQAQGWNSVSTGVASVGTHTSTDVTPEAFNAIASIVGWKLSIHGVPAQGTVTLTSSGGAANRYASGRRVKFQRISGHRDGGSTSCPGDALYAQLPALRARAAGQSFDTGLSIRLPRQKVAQGKAATVTGRLVFPDGAPPAGVGLEVQARTAQGWVTQGQTATAADGGWTTQVLVPYSRALRARVPSNGARAELRSPTVRLQVKPTIRAAMARKDVRRRTRPVVHGRTIPVRKKQKVTVTVERRIGR